MTKVRIRLSGEQSKDLDNVVSQLSELAVALGMKFIGPVRLPRRKLSITTRRTPCGDGSDTYEHWEKRISKRLVDIEGDEKYIKQILRVKVPTNVFVRISLS
ncbi:MAG TPA: 30S ribosomal protein S10 [Candidatus Bilamarchaeaceae archaeon]|nr:30S ribosomal protein S10 [Candidatus Bilamarchaeaceae archaeon]